MARLGGDEFVVLIQELSSDCTTSTEQVSVIAEKIRFLLSQPYRLMRGRQDRNPPDWLEHHCSASLGAALCSEAVGSADDVLKYADQAMYQAKNEGRNRVCLYDPMG